MDSRTPFSEEFDLHFQLRDITINGADQVFQKSFGCIFRELKILQIGTDILLDPGSGLIQLFACQLLQVATQVDIVVVVAAGIDVGLNG